MEHHVGIMIAIASTDSAKATEVSNALQNAGFDTEIFCGVSELIESENITECAYILDLDKNIILDAYYFDRRPIEKDVARQILKIRSLG